MKPKKRENKEQNHKVTRKIEQSENGGQTIAFDRKARYNRESFIIQLRPTWNIMVPGRALRIESVASKVSEVKFCPGSENWFCGGR
mgnify:CR=1 FL=1